MSLDKMHPDICPGDYKTIVFLPFLPLLLFRLKFNPPLSPYLPTCAQKQTHRDATECLSEIRSPKLLRKQRHLLRDVCTAKVEG